MANQILRWTQGHIGWCEVGVRVLWSEFVQTGGQSPRGTDSMSVTPSLIACDWGSEHRIGAPRFTFSRLGVGCFKNIQDTVLYSFIEV